MRYAKENDLLRSCLAFMINVQNSNGFDHTTMEKKMARGGSRPGAGRKAFSGVFGEKNNC